MQLLFWLYSLIKHTAAHLNCSFCLLRFASICYKAYSKGTSWKGHDRRFSVKTGKSKSQVCVVGSDLQLFKVCSLVHWWANRPWLFSIGCITKQDDPAWVVHSWALMVDFCTHEGIRMISVIKKILVFFCMINSGHPRMTSAFYLSCHKFPYFCW